MNKHRWNGWNALLARRGVLKRLAVAMGLAVAGVARQSSAQAPENRERATAAVRAVIERYADAWQRGDIAAIQECYHSDFTLHYFGHNSLTGTHVGKQRSLATLAEFSRRTRRRLIRIEATMAGPERGGIIARERFGEGDGAVELQRVLIYSIADNRLRECWVYDADPEEIDRLLSPG